MHGAGDGGLVPGQDDVHVSVVPRGGGRVLELGEGEALGEEAWDRFGLPGAQQVPQLPRDDLVTGSLPECRAAQVGAQGVIPGKPRVQVSFEVQGAGGGQVDGRQCRIGADE